MGSGRNGLLEEVEDDQEDDRLAHKSEGCMQGFTFLKGKRSFSENSRRGSHYPRTFQKL